MNKSLRKIVYWGSGLSVYAFMITAVFVLLFELEFDQFFQTQENPTAVFEDHKGELSLLKAVGQSTGYSKILLPLGPDDLQLPGLPEIWDEFLRVDGANVKKMNGNGFDGLQAVKRIAEFSRGSVGELFLSGKPLQAFRRGSFLLSLNNSGKVQIVDCANPHEPKVSGLLPYQNVRYMEMHGDVAYLLLPRPDAQHEELLIADLSNPHQPREISRLNLPDQTMSFFVRDHQLMVYADSGSYKGDDSIHLYDLTDDLQLVPLGSTSSPSLKDGFIPFDDYLLTKDSRVGLHVYDFSDPLHPFVAASLELNDVIRLLIRHGDTVFALGERKRVYVIDMHDPLQPVVSTVVEEANHSAQFMMHDHHIYYFTRNGYLQVFGIPTFLSSFNGSKKPVTVAGELMPAQAGAGFTLLGESQDSLPIAVTDVQSLPDETEIIDKLFWRGFLVILDNDGLIQFFHRGKGGLLDLQESLQLPSAQRWLATSDNRLYVGGGSAINVIAEDESGNFILSSQIESSGAESWDGLVVQKTLCVASGKDGVLCFSIEDPDLLLASHSWMIPRQLESLVDVRQLSSAGGNRVLAAAGSVGLLNGQITSGGQLEFVGLIDFPVPIYALATVNDFCLISTGSDIRVVDIRNSDSLQKLGEIAFPGVTRFAVASPDSWAGYVPGVGWSVLPAPRIVLPGETERLQNVGDAESVEHLHDRYRLKLFNDREVITVPGILTLSDLSDDRTTGAAHGLQ